LQPESFVKKNGKRSEKRSKKNKKNFENKFVKKEKFSTFAVQKKEVL